MKKSLDKIILRIKNNKYSPRDFIIADDKDGVIAMGITTPGSKRNENGKVLKGYKKLVDYKNAMILMTKSNLVDIMLMSASVGEDLVKRNLFKNSSITPAIRMNDTTDIWLMRNGNYRKTYPRPFRSAQINKVSKLVNHGLFSVTFSNNVEYDLAMLNAY